MSILRSWLPRNRDPPASAFFSKSYRPAPPEPASVAAAPILLSYVFYDVTAFSNEEIVGYNAQQAFAPNRTVNLAHAVLCRSHAHFPPNVSHPSL